MRSAIDAEQHARAGDTAAMEQVADLLQHYSNAALIVVGRRRRPLIRKLVHGPATNSALVKHASAPVVVVPSG